MISLKNDSCHAYFNLESFNKNNEDQVNMFLSLKKRSVFSLSHPPLVLSSFQSKSPIWWHEASSHVTPPLTSIGVFKLLVCASGSLTFRHALFNAPIQIFLCKFQQWRVFGNDGVLFSVSPIFRVSCLPSSSFLVIVSSLKVFGFNEFYGGRFDVTLMFCYKDWVCYWLFWLTSDYFCSCATFQRCWCWILHVHLWCFQIF